MNGTEAKKVHQDSANTGLFSQSGIFVNTMNGKISAATGLGTTHVILAQLIGTYM